MIGAQVRNTITGQTGVVVSAELNRGGTQRPDGVWEGRTVVYWTEGPQPKGDLYSVRVLTDEDSTCHACGGLTKRHYRWHVSRIEVIEAAQPAMFEEATDG